MLKSPYLSAHLSGSGSATAAGQCRQRESAEYRGFGGYNRTAMARVSRTMQRATRCNSENNEDALLLSVSSNIDSVDLTAKRKRRTWDGVFLPVSISIFGVVLFFRLPWIVGECGLWLSLVGIALSFFVTLLTTCSLAAISTNGHVGDGGAYMMVSRCLGPQVGVTVGITLVLANTLASAMYLVGSVEVVVHLIGNAVLLHWLRTQTYGTTVIGSTLMLLFLLAVSMLKLVRVFRVVCFLLTFAALLDFVVFSFASTTPRLSEGFTGVSGQTLRDNWSPEFSEGTGFQKALYVLFPGVCGLMSGVSGSGELKNGSKAIPKGIMYAWFLTLGTYLVTAVVVAASFERSFLKTDYHIMERAVFLPLFLPGAFCASFAAVLSGVVGSSRVLTAIAADGILPFRFFDWIARCRPQVSVLVLYACVQVTILFGNGYALFSVFATEIFLVTFLALNVSVFISSALTIASFRPMFSFFNTLTAFTGAMAALVLMFFIAPMMAFCVLLFMLAVLVLVDLYFDPSKVYWGDASQPVLFHFVRKFLLRLDERKAHVRHWRPSILHVVTDPLCSLNLIHLANNLKKGGLYEVCLVLRGDFHSTTRAVFRWKGWLMDFIEASGVKAFPVVTSAEELHQAVQGMLHLSGLGCMRPNTILLSMDELLQREHFQWIYSTYRSGKSAVQTGTDEQERACPRFKANNSTKEGNEEQGRHSSSNCTCTATSISGGAVPCPSAHHVPHTPLWNAVSEDSTAPFLHHGISADDGPPLGAGSVVATALPGKDSSRSMRGGSLDGCGGKRLSSFDGERVGMGSDNPSPYMLPKDLHTLQSGIEDALPMEESWSQWLKESMWGKKFMSKDSITTDSRSPLPPVEGVSGTEWAAAVASTPAGSVFSAGREGVPWPRSTLAYRTRRSLRWGLFRSGRGDAEEDVEQRLVEQMVAHRHNAQLTGDVDLAGYRDKREFYCIAWDAASTFMNVVIARNMDLLDTDAIEKRGKKRKWFIDVWFPDESDATLYLMAHCVRLTSLWKKYAEVRVVSVVTANEEVPQRVREVWEVLRSHRLLAYPRVVTLEDEMARCGVSDLVTMERRFEDPRTRSAVINSLVSAEVERTGGRVAMVMMRVPPPPPPLATTITEQQQQQQQRGEDGGNGTGQGEGSGTPTDDDAEAWVESLQGMTSRLPPCLLLAGETLHCRSTDW